VLRLFCKEAPPRLPLWLCIFYQKPPDAVPSPSSQKRSLPPCQWRTTLEIRFVRALSSTTLLSLLGSSKVQLSFLFPGCLLALPTRFFLESSSSGEFGMEEPPPLCPSGGWMALLIGAVYSGGPEGGAEGPPPRASNYIGPRLNLVIHSVFRLSDTQLYRAPNVVIHSIFRLSDTIA
jgi:hypothetical protein